jgi:hypothetical protein
VLLCCYGSKTCTIGAIIGKSHGYASFWRLHKITPLNSRLLKVINRLLDSGEKFEEA